MWRERSVWPTSYNWRGTGEGRGRRDENRGEFEFLGERLSGAKGDIAGQSGATRKNYGCSFRVPNLSLFLSFFRFFVPIFLLRPFEPRISLLSSPILFAGVHLARYGDL